MLFLKSNRKKPETDPELIEKYRNSGDSAYIGELFQRYTHLAFGVAMKYFKNEDDSKDTVMEVFEKILTDLKRHEVENFQAWLYFVVKNHCLMKLRQGKTLRSHKESFEKFVVQFMESEVTFHLNNSTPADLEQVLAMGIDNLKDEQRSCIELFYFEEKSYNEIASTTGFSINQVKSFLQNGKRNLEIYLKHRYEH